MQIKYTYVNVEQNIIEILINIDFIHEFQCFRFGFILHQHEIYISGILSFVEVPCLKDMENQGVIPKDKLEVTKQDNTDGSKTFVVKSQKPTEELPVWSSVTVKPDDATKEVTFTPLNKDNTPAGDAKTVPVPEGSTQPIKVTFDTPTPADRVQVDFKPKSPLTPAGGDIISVVACMSEQGTTVFLHSGLL